MLEKCAKWEIPSTTQVVVSTTNCAVQCIAGFDDSYDVAITSQSSRLDVFFKIRNFIIFLGTILPN